MLNKRRIFVLIGMFILLAGVGWGVTKAIHYSESPEFCGLCHSVMDPAHESWEAGPHYEQARCMDCHADPGFVGFVKAKVRGSKELYTFLTSDITAKDLKGTKVPNRRCQECHGDISEQKKFEGLIFPHVSKEHASQSCQNCHPNTGHTGQDEYFGEYGNTWNVRTCASCHNGKKGGAFSMTRNCSRCHTAF